MEPPLPPPPEPCVLKPPKMPPPPPALMKPPVWRLKVVPATSWTAPPPAPVSFVSAPLPSASAVFQTSSAGGTTTFRPGSFSVDP